MLVLGFTCENILTKYLLVEVGEREETRASGIFSRHIMLRKESAKFYRGHFLIIIALAEHLLLYNLITGLKTKRYRVEDLRGLALAKC